MQHIGPQVPPNQKGKRELREGRGKGGRGIKSGWLATPMARYREEGTGEKVGRAGALCATQGTTPLMSTSVPSGTEKGEGSFADLRVEVSHRHHRGLPSWTDFFWQEGIPPLLSTGVRRHYPSTGVRGWSTDSTQQSVQCIQAIRIRVMGRIRNKNPIKLFYHIVAKPEYYVYFICHLKQYNKIKQNLLLAGLPPQKGSTTASTFLYLEKKIIAELEQIIFLDFPLKNVFLNNIFKSFIILAESSI